MIKKIFLILFLFLIINNPVFALDTDDLLAYYDMETTDKLIDIYAGHNGTLTSITLTNDGVIDNGYLFNTGHATITDSNTLAQIGTGDFTLNFWLNKTANAGYYGAYNFGAGNTYADQIDGLMYDTHLQVRYREGGSGNNEMSCYIPSGNDVGDMHMFTITRIGTTSWCYVNGVLNATTSGVEVAVDFGTASGYEEDIGVLQGDAFAFVGSFDEFSIWSVALNQNNITESYNGGAGYNPLSVANTLPNVTLLTPADDYNTDDTTPDFIFSYSDGESDLGICELFVDDVASGIIPANFSVNTATVQVGTYNSGNIASLTSIDGDVYNVSEISSSPAFTIEFNVSIGNNTPSKVWYYVDYDGNLGHNIDFLVKKDDGTYEILNSFSDGNHYFNVTLTQDHVKDGVLSFLFNHTSSGNVNHELVIDYFSVDIIVNETGFLTINHTLSEGVFEWFINCSDGTGTTKSEVFSLTIDTTDPLIEWFLPLDDDSTMFTDANISFNTNINISDDNLFSLNFTIHNSSGGLIQNLEIINFNITSYNINETVNLSSMDYGIYTINVTVSDDHTSNSWSAEKIDFKDKRLKIDDFISIMPENFDIIGYNIIEYPDHIGYSFSPDAFSPEMLSYEVECDAGLVYLPDSKYKGHFVCGNYWIDFENTQNHPVTVQIINDKKAIVYTKANSFQSIGGLNIVSETTIFTYGAVLNLADPIPANNSIIYTDYVDFSVIGNFSFIGNCSLFINDTFNISTNISVSDDLNVSFLNITLVDGQYDFYINCMDQVSNINTSTHNFLMIHANCTDIGTIDSCTIYDNTTQRKIYDPAGCHVDINVTVACNYCSENLESTLGVCVDDNQTITYVDNNFISCCYLTNIGSDCSILSSPYNETTYQSCQSLIQNFTCSIPNFAEFKPIMPFSCIMPDYQEYQCIVNVFEDGRLVQTNPQQAIYGASLLIGKRQETREFFTTSNGLLNAYFTNKNIETDHQFRVDAICSNGSIIYTSQNNVKPFYDTASSVLNRTIWAKENSTYLILAIIFVVIALGLIGYAWNRIRGG